MDRPARNVQRKRLSLGTIYWQRGRRRRYSRSWGRWNEAELLTRRPGEQGNRGGQWRWQQLSPMQEKRTDRPGPILLIGRQRVIVCGGGNLSGRGTAEILKLPRGDNDRGVWTLPTQPMTQSFSTTVLITFYNRIIAIGELLTKLAIGRLWLA